MAARAFSEVRLINGSTGDPSLYIDYPGSDNALLFDCGDNCALDLKQLGDLEAVFITHHHVDHFIGFDRIMRANMDHEKTLHLFGPPGTIGKVYQRLTAYAHPFFPFQKCIFRVYDLLPGKMQIADIESARRFAEPEIREQIWKSRVIYETEYLRVEATAVEHTAPNYAYALTEKTGFHPDPEKMKVGALRMGPWVQQALKLLREEASLDTVMEIDGGRFLLGKLRENYFSKSPGARVAYVTDTVWSEAVRPGLIQLAKNATRLYCDSYYSIAQVKSANTHKHMTATHAAELAKLAKVDQLVLMHFAPRYAGNYGPLIEEARAIFPRVTADLG
jgi:ribonuclease Z